MENTQELTLQVSQNTIDAIKEFALSKGQSGEAATAHISKIIDGLIGGALKGNTATFALRASAIQKLNAFAHLRGSSAEEVALEVSETLSDLLEEILKNRIAQELGITVAATQPVKGKKAAVAPVVQQPFTDTTGISDGLGDDDDSPDPEHIEPEESEDALIPESGGLTDEDIEHDMDIDDPSTEAKGDAGTFGETLAQAQEGHDRGEDLFADIAGFPADDSGARTLKRRRGPSKSKGKVKMLTEAVEHEGAGA